MLLVIGRALFTIEDTKYFMGCWEPISALDADIVV